MAMPFYQGKVRYLTRFKLDEPLKKLVFLCPGFKASCLSYSLNGSEEELIWPPYAVDISSKAKSGENSLEITVYGSLKNLLGPHHNFTTPGLVTPWSFKFAPQIQPSGADYDFVDYGLFGEIKIIAE